MTQIRIRRISGITALFGMLLFITIIFLIIRYLWKAIIYIIIFFMVLGIIKNITSKMNDSMFSRNNKNRTEQRPKNRNSTEEKDKNKTNHDIIDVENYKIE